MLDIAFIRANLDAVRSNCVNRAVKADVDAAIRIDQRP